MPQAERILEKMLTKDLHSRIADLREIEAECDHLRSASAPALPAAGALPRFQTLIAEG